MSFLKYILLVLLVASLLLLIWIKRDPSTVAMHAATSSEPKETIITPDTTIYHKQYYLLNALLSVYDTIESSGGWDSVPPTKDSIRMGKINPIIKKLRTRLMAERYIKETATLRSDSFDLDLKNALEKFQKNNGLTVTGELNSKTTAALNIPIEKRKKQIRINRERWKKLPKEMEDEYLFVNSANFMLEVIKADSVVLSMKTIVGRPYRRTPIFNSYITSIIFNPNWYIPVRIMKNDILPQVIKDATYLEEKNIRIFQTDVKGKRKEVHADSIDWKTISIKTFSYSLMQDAGTDNSLGAIKFMFPNKYNVYMHDTPTKKLFEKTERTFSSGCIRLSNALALAEYLLKDKWDRKKIIRTIENENTVSVNLTEPVKIYIEYFTAWVDKNGDIQFRKDVYNRDQEIID